MSYDTDYCNLYPKGRCHINKPAANIPYKVTI